MLELCAVAFGGALGAVGRYAVGLAVAALAPEALLGGFPVATLIANVFGCFVIGVLSALFEGPFAGRDHVRLFAVTGVLGVLPPFPRSASKRCSCSNRAHGGWRARMRP